jgi:hypothetical protein
MSRAETLFDIFQMKAAAKNSPYAGYESILRRARCFVLDDGMSSFLAELATRSFHELVGNMQPKFEVSPIKGSGVSVTGTDEQIAALIKKMRRIGDGLRVLAKAPHAVTWIEFDFHLRFDRYLQAYSAHGVLGEKNYIKNRRTSFKYCGWLIEQLTEDEYRCTPVMGDHGDIEVSPFSYFWNTNPKQSEVTAAKHLFQFSMSHPEAHDARFDDPIGDKSELFSHSRLAARMSFGTPALNGLAEIGRNIISHYFKDPDIDQGMGEMRGELRYVWSLLAAINDLPVGIRKVERSRGFMAKRNYQKFMSHSVISLILPKRMTEQKLAKLLVGISRRRAHEVRGHFRTVGADKRKTWIKEHIRGDASLGWVTHSYQVKHEEA